MVSIYSPSTNGYEQLNGLQQPSVSVGGGNNLGGGAVGQGGALLAGSIQRIVSATGLQPGATAADNVLAVYSIPANFFDGLGNRAIDVMISGAFANTANTKRVKIIFNPATAVVGSTVGAGGSLVADTGAVTTQNLGFWLSGTILKYGALGSNTQMIQQLEGAAGTTHLGALVPVLATAIENAPILLAITGNATTAVTDILLQYVEITGMN